MKSVERAANDYTVLESPSTNCSRQIVELLQNNKQQLIDLWVETIRAEFKQPASTTDVVLANHIRYVLDVLIQELRKFADQQQGRQSTVAMVYAEGIIVDDKFAGNDHGKQRAEVNAYNVDKVYWEYVLLRKIIVEFLQQHNLLDIEHLQLITHVIESCSRDSLSTFTRSVQNVQRKLLGSLVHDLRNPLNVISVVGSLMAMEDHSTVGVAYASKLERAARRMSVMLEDMLQTISIEGGQGLELTFKKEQLHSYFKVLVDDTKALYGTRFIAVLADSPIEGTFDAFAVIRIVENLLANAFKYGGRDTSVTLTVAESDTDITIAVHNDGNPIPQQNWESIFGFLKRYEGQEPNRDKSWGIGLAIAKAAAQGHNGSISLNSSEAEGTTFTLNLPKWGHQPGEVKTISM